MLQRCGSAWTSSHMLGEFNGLVVLIIFSNKHFCKG